MKKILPFLFLALGAAAQQPTVFLMNPERLIAVRTAYARQDAAAMPLVAGLKKQADALLDMQALSVMDKAFTPVSGSKHDYMSQAPYFWYDSTKPNGLPYMRKDGQHNPEINRITDHQNLGALDNAVRTLALAWYLTGEEKYAAKASSLIRHWFFNEATRMNPNLEYAQGIPGINHGRGIGIIETRALTGIADAAGLLATARPWTAADTKALQQWYTQYLNWMLTSKNGQDEHAARNNHGTWYLVQAIDFALFTGNAAKAKELSGEARQKIETQITGEGKMPLELERTNALGYSTFNLQAWFQAAWLAQQAGVDLWHYKNAQGAGLQTALDWLAPYALGEKKWPYQQIGKYNSREFNLLLIEAAKPFSGDPYLQKASGQKERDAMTALLYE